MSDAARRAVEAVWRIESGRLVAALARLTRDVSLAEDCAQEALVSALLRWPADGVPDRPGAWLLAAGRRKALDRLRHDKMRARTEGPLAAELEAARPDAPAAVDAALDDPVGDDLLALLFACCHPALNMEARVALTLRTVAGLTTEEIARAFVAPVPTVQQRIVRAKRTLSEAKVPFEVPRGPALAARLASVLEVVYLVFNEGYSATAGEDWMRPALCEDALRLGRILARLMPGESEVHGLVALMEIQASRFHARIDATGAPILLLDQDRARWDRLLVARGLAALERAGQAGALGPYALQAAIAACHARARTAAETDWPRIAALYDALAQLSPSPVVEVNRAVAYGLAFGPAEGLAVLDGVADDPRLAAYHLLPSVRGDLLFRLGRPAEARAEFERAAGLTKNERERAFLAARAAACGPGAGAAEARARS